jgi:3-hydroxyacyl-CoA dehydrogenase
VDPRTSLENAFWLACDDLLIAHTNPWELDEALKNFGFVVGPCEVMDHIGLMDVHARRSAHASNVLPRMVTEGRVGKIGGVGFYRYPGGGGAVIDPLIEDLILEEARFAKIQRTELTDDQIVDCILEKLSSALREHNQENISEILYAHLHFPKAKRGLI